MTRSSTTLVLLFAGSMTAVLGRPVRCHLFYMGTERVEVDGVMLTPIASLYRGR